MKKNFSFRNSVRVVCVTLIMSLLITSCNTVKEDSLIPTQPSPTAVVTESPDGPTTVIFAGELGGDGSQKSETDNGEVSNKDEAENNSSETIEVNENNTSENVGDTENNEGSETNNAEGETSEGENSDNDDADPSDNTDGASTDNGDVEPTDDTDGVTTDNNDTEKNELNNSDTETANNDSSETTGDGNTSVDSAETGDSSITDNNDTTEKSDSEDTKTDNSSENEKTDSDDKKDENVKTDDKKDDTAKTDDKKEDTVKTDDKKDNSGKKNGDKKEKESNRYKSEELEDYISVKVTDMTDEEFAQIAPTVNMSFEELVGDNGIYNGYPKAFPKPDTYKIVVDLRYCIVMVFTKDDAGNYTVPHRFMICSPGASSSNTPTGTFGMKDYKVRFSLFNNTASYGQYWSLINGRIYFHSVLYSSMNASDYTESSFNNLGHGASHGCIRLTVPDARWIWYNIGPDTTCIIRYGSKDDEQMQEIKKRLVLTKLPSKRVKLVKGEIPNTDNWSIDEVPQEVPYVNGHQ